MAIARLQVRGPRTTPGVELDDAVELYQRTYSTLLRSSGETRLRVLEPSHRAMGSSLHPLADSDELDLGAFLYAIRRLPAGIVRARRIVMGQDPELFARSGVGPLEDWEPVEAPARRRRWYDGGVDTLAGLLASASDVDDLVPTLVAFQIEWNKINQRMRAAGFPDGSGEERDPAECAATLGGAMDDWLRLRDAWGEAFDPQLREIAARRLSLRVRMLGGTQVGYARMTRRWWAPVRARLVERRLPGRDRQRRLSARARRLQHPPRGRRRLERAARGVRARQGRDAERRRRRRDDLERRPRRAQRHDVLAGQHVLGPGHRTRPPLRDRPRQPARGHGEEHVPAEPLLPRLLLPRGVHGRRDGGGAVLQPGLRDRGRRALSGWRGGELLQAAGRLRRHPLRIGHAVHAGAHAGRPRLVLLRDGLDVRRVARDHASRAA